MAHIRGAVEPDRYVMVGNHRDAWGFGAIGNDTIYKNTIKKSFKIDFRLIFSVEIF